MSQEITFLSFPSRNKTILSIIGLKVPLVSCSPTFPCLSRICLILSCVSIRAFSCDDMDETWCPRLSSSWVTKGKMRRRSWHDDRFFFLTIRLDFLWVSCPDHDLLCMCSAYICLLFLDLRSTLFLLMMMMMMMCFYLCNLLYKYFEYNLDSFHLKRENKREWEGILRGLWVIIGSQAHPSLILRV